MASEPASSEERTPAEEARIRALSAAPCVDNRRGNARFAVELDVSISSDHNFYAGFTENLSAGGIFVATHALKAAGSLIELCIFLPGASGAIRGKGEVRWIRNYQEGGDVPPGMGIRFVELEAGSPERIESFLRQREPMFFDDD
ncbi:MAG: TIGR02266 family protein [Myxococcales bacterium]|nr:TIGR02266 family protein [Myxococcales bacterium]